MLPLRSILLSGRAGLVASVLVVAAGCSGFGGLEDPVSIEFNEDGVVRILSCRDGDRLREFVVSRDEVVLWSAEVDEVEDGLLLDDVPVSLDALVDLPGYSVSGDVVPSVVEGDFVEFASTADSGRFEVIASMIGGSRLRDC